MDNPNDTFAFEGFELVVPAGAWAEGREVDLANSTFSWDTPGYPDGFVPVPSDPGGTVEIEIYRQTGDGGRVYAPDSMYLELHFPLVLYGVSGGPIDVVDWYRDTQTTCAPPPLIGLSGEAISRPGRGTCPARRASP